ncbi:MAG: dephospho-CoA kinase [Lachnospiraceae bacterium]|nr:dephospho-CoA kinase [Lachnospiraceae bacterium]
MRFIGITGGIGAGKSELLCYIQRHYRCEIYLADQAAHEVKQAGTACYRQLVELLGRDILDPRGEIDRQRMAERIFASSDLLEQVNHIIHPAVKEYLLNRLKAARVKGEAELFFVEAALLVECGYGGLVDEMWYIYADEETRRRRLSQSRGYSGERIDQIMDSQLSEQAFRNACDFVIDNSGALEESFRQIDRKLEAYTWRE